MGPGIRLGWRGGVNTYAYVGGKPLSWIDTHGLFGDGRSYGIDMDSKGPRGHSDFYGGGLYGFDYVEEDHDFFSHPYNIFTGTANHFRDLKDSEGDARKTCDPKKFGRLMHQVQDYYSHYNRGYRYSILSAVAFLAAPGPYLYATIIMGKPGHGLGHLLQREEPYNGDDNGSWDQANQKTKELVDDFYKRCGCKK